MYFRGVPTFKTGRGAVWNAARVLGARSLALELHQLQQKSLNSISLSEIHSVVGHTHSLERAPLPRVNSVADETLTSGNGTRQAGPICRSARLAAAWVIGTRNGRACDDFRALHGVRFGGGGKPSRRPERRGEVATEKFPGTGGAPCRGGKRPDGLRRSRAART